MSNLTNPHDSKGVEKLQGHTVGFVDTPANCEAMIRDFKRLGFTAEKIRVFQGDAGIDEWEQAMEGFQWGESAEAALKEGVIELQLGHSIIVVEVKNDQEASAVAAISSQHGGHGVFHFGPLIDTRLTP